MSQDHKPYYSFLHQKKTDEVDETYYDPKNFDWVNTLENNWEIIRGEVLNFSTLNEKELKPYFVKEMMNAPEKWKAFSFYFWGLRMSKKACYHCPNTLKLLSTIPNILSVSVSVMEPEAEIKPHYGDTDSVYRVHLGLDVPEKLPLCGFRVGYEDRSWENGKVLIFNDAAYHKAWNKTKSRRVILLFDILKPDYIDQKNWICSRVRGNMVWQFFSSATGIFKGKSNAFTKFIGWINAIIIWPYVSLLNRKSL